VGGGNPVAPAPTGAPAGSGSPGVPTGAIGGSGRAIVGPPATARHRGSDTAAHAAVPAGGPLAALAAPVTQDAGLLGSVQARVASTVQALRSRATRALAPGVQKAGAPGGRNPASGPARAPAPSGSEDLPAFWFAMPPAAEAAEAAAAATPASNGRPAGQLIAIVLLVVVVLLVPSMIVASITVRHLPQASATTPPNGSAEQLSVAGGASSRWRVARRAHRERASNGGHRTEPAAPPTETWAAPPVPARNGPSQSPVPPPVPARDGR
jgi:hypothetical protein